MQSDPLTSSGIDRHGDQTVSEVDVQQITVDAQRPPSSDVVAPMQGCVDSAE